ncbi:MAG: hypothetical protein WBQ03_25815 [Candidatus Sulfotelmatobacter sp.]
MRILPIAILCLSIVLLFLVPRLWHEETGPAVPDWTIRGLESMRGIEVTGPEGNTVPLSDAVKNGCVGLHTTVSGSILNTPSARPIFELSNKTTKPVHIRTPRDAAGSVTPKNLDIPPGDTRLVEADTVNIPSYAKNIMPVVVSVILLIGGLFIILAKRYQPSDRHWAYATVGTIVGYWLKA